MIQVVQQIIVRPEVQGQFELVYGPGGAWSRLFGQSPGFRGTTMLHDMNHPRRYLIFDLWDSEAQHQQALNDCAEQYARLKTDLDDWAESRQELGVFRMRAEATVRPRGKPGGRGRR